MFELGAVTGETMADDGSWELDISLEEREFQRFLKRTGLAETILEYASAEGPARALTQR